MSGIPQGAIEIGSHFYLFKSGTNKEDCLISAHGGYDKNVNTFNVKGYRVLFYGAHGNTLSDPGVAMMNFQKPTVVDEYPNSTTRNCMNYILSKYQGAHSAANETYEKISGRIASEDQQIAVQSAKMNDPNLKDWQRSMAEKLLAASNSMNVLTIRNRAWRSDQSLEAAIVAARKAMPSLTNFHCSFCRSLIGDPNAGVSKVYSPDL